VKLQFDYSLDKTNEVFSVDVFIEYFELGVIVFENDSALWPVVLFDKRYDLFV